ncbi:MAG: restriction endonuclease subunit S [Thermoguttaceae bacterium]|nr:restriction endonuclease subunit S [Thermoguttaceae bacterium]
MNNWKKCRLGDACYFGKDRIDIANLNLSNYISTENMLPERGGITEAANLPSVEQTPCFFADDILVSNIRPYFKKIWRATFSGGCSPDVLVFKAKENISKRYLYYILSADIFFNYCTTTSKGTKMPRGDKIAIMNYPVNLPPLSVQRKIAAVLSSLDDKIELNNRINANLEQQAQAIYQEYIVSASNYSKNGIISDYCSVKSGYAFKSNWWLDDGIRVIKIKSIENKKINLIECSYVSEDILPLAEEFSVIGGDLLIAMTGATIGKFAIVPQVDEPLLVNQRVGKFFLGNNPIKKLPFIYCTLNNQEIINEIINKGQGSAQPNISGNDILSTPCYYPDNSVITEFNKICSPLFETIIINQRENRTLAALRDALLPKLMSGEIDVSMLQI